MRRMLMTMMSFFVDKGRGGASGWHASDTQLSGPGSLAAPTFTGESRS